MLPFLPIFSAAGGLLSSGLASDAQKRMAKSIEKVSAADLPAAWQAQLNTITANSRASAATFNQSLADQEKMTKLALYGGAALIVVLLLVK